MLVEHVEGKTVEEVKQFAAKDMLGLFGAKLTPNRQKCCLLSWRVLQAAIYSPIASGESDAPAQDSSPKSNGSPARGAQ
jgi:nitrogen fixation NifU-like protein